MNFTAESAEDAELMNGGVKEGLINSVFIMPAKAGIQLVYDFPGFRLAGLRPLAGMTN